MQHAITEMTRLIAGTKYAITEARYLITEYVVI